MSFHRFAKRSGQTRKMGNTPTVCALGHSHRSKLEGAVCQMLQLRARAGELEILQVEDHVYLTDARIGYIPDFKCRDVKTGAIFWVEAKGFANDRWPIKKKLWKFYGPGRLEIWMGSHLNPRLSEIIESPQNARQETAQTPRQTNTIDQSSALTAKNDDMGIMHETNGTGA